MPLCGILVRQSSVNMTESIYVYNTLDMVFGVVLTKGSKIRKSR